MEKLFFIVVTRIVPVYFINNSLRLLLRNRCLALCKQQKETSWKRPISPIVKQLTAPLTVQSLFNQRVYARCSVPGC